MFYYINMLSLKVGEWLVLLPYCNKFDPQQ